MNVWPRYNPYNKYVGVPAKCLPPQNQDVAYSEYIPHDYYRTYDIYPEQQIYDHHYSTASRLPASRFPPHGLDVRDYQAQPRPYSQHYSRPPTIRAERPPSSNQDRPPSKRARLDPDFAPEGEANPVRDSNAPGRHYGRSKDLSQPMPIMRGPEVQTRGSIESASEMPKTGAISRLCVAGALDPLELNSQDEAKFPDVQALKTLIQDRKLMLDADAKDIGEDEEVRGTEWGREAVIDVCRDLEHKIRTMERPQKNTWDTLFTLLSAEVFSTCLPGPYPDAWDALSSALKVGSQSHAFTTKQCNTLRYASIASGWVGKALAHCEGDIRASVENEPALIGKLIQLIKYRSEYPDGVINGSNSERNGESSKIQIAPIIRELNRLRLYPLATTVLQYICEAVIPVSKNSGDDKESKGKMTKRESMKDSSEMKLASVERKALRSPSVIFFNSATCLDVLTVLTSVGKDIAGNKSDKVRALDRAATECIRMWQREIKLHAYAVVRSWIFSPPKSEYSPQVIYELLSHAIPAFIRRNQLLTGLMSNFHSKFGQWLQRTLHKDTHTSAKPLNDLTATQVVKLLHELRWKNMPPKERPGNVFDSSSRCWLNPPSVFKWSVPVEEVLYALESNGVSVTSPEFAAGGLKWFLQFQRTGQCLRAYLHRANAQIPALWLAPVECTVELLDCQNKGIGGQPASRSGWSVLDGNFGYGVPPFKHVTSKSLRQGKASRHIDSDKNLKLKVYLSVDPGLAFILNHVVANFGDFSAENESWVARGKTGDVPLLAELPLVPIVRIFRSDALNVPSEKVVLEAMLTWTRTALCFGDGPKSAAERQAAAERLSSYIRFRHLDFPTLYKAARDPLLAKLKLLECNMDSSLQRDIQGGGASKGMPKRDGYIGVPVETGLATVDVFKCLVQNIERLKQEKAEMAGEVKRLAAVVQSLVKKERKFESMTAKSKEDEKHDPPVCTREEGGEKRGC